MSMERKQLNLSSVARKAIELIRQLYRLPDTISCFELILRETIDENPGLVRFQIGQFQELLALLEEALDEEARRAQINLAILIAVYNLQKQSESSDEFERLHTLLLQAEEDGSPIIQALYQEVELLLDQPYFTDLVSALEELIGCYGDEGCSLDRLRDVHQRYLSLVVEMELDCAILGRAVWVASFNLSESLDDWVLQSIAAHLAE